MVDVRILGVCATPVKRKAAKGITNTEVLATRCIESAKAAGAHTDLIFLGEDGFSQDCDMDNWCLLKQTEDKFCAKNDVMTTTYYPLIRDADGLIVVSPVYVGRMSGICAAFLGRLRALAEGKAYGFRRPGGANLKDKVLGAGAVAWYRHGGVETAMQSILLTASIFGLIPVTVGPGKAAGAGFGYGAGGVSIGKMDELANVKNDEYAMLSADNLGRRVVEMARIIKAGKEALAKGA